MATPPTMPLVFWMLWMSLSTGVILLRAIIAFSGEASSEAGALDLVALTLLTTGLCGRWIILPKLPGTLARKLPPFIASLALIEACALLALFTAPRHREELLLLALLALLTAAPLFALKSSAGDMPR